MKSNKTTGAYETRKELEDTIWFLYRTTACGQATIARHCNVSTATVSKILTTVPCQPTNKKLPPYNGRNDRRTVL
jgi:hypothetical protein